MTILDGNILLGSDFLVTPKLTESNFLESTLGVEATIFISNGTHHSYKLKETNIEGKNFLPIIYFSENILTEIHLHLVDQKYWDKYSEKSESLKKTMCDNWLRDILSEWPPYHYSWGSIESVFDKKMGASFILIRYSNC